MRLRLLVTILNAAAKVGEWLLVRYVPSAPPPGAWHPSQGPRPAVPAMPRQRDVTVDDDTLELAQHEALCALLRVHGFLPTPVTAAAEIAVLEAVWRSPAAEVEGR